MPDLSTLVSTLRSPRTAFAIFIFSAALLFAPFEGLGLKRPTFTSEYEAFIVVVLFLSAAILAVEILSLAWSLTTRPYYAWKRKQWVLDVFLSLNLQELCFLWAMTQQGLRTVKGSSSNNLMLSLRQKGCLYIVPGIQTVNQLHHAMPDEIFKIVSERGLARIPDNVKNSSQFEDRVRSIFSEATGWWGS